MSPKPKFEPNSEVLKPILQRHEEFAEINGAIVDEVAKRFKEFPPDEGMENILKADEG